MKAKVKEHEVTTADAERWIDADRFEYQGNIYRLDKESLKIVWESEVTKCLNT